MVPSPNLLGAALRGECVWRRTWVRFSARHRSGLGRLPVPCPAPSPPPPCTRTLPADAHRPRLGENWTVPGLGVSPFYRCTPLAVAHVLCCCRLVQNMSKSLKKLVEESREKNQPEVDMSDRGISNMLDVNGLCKFWGWAFPLQHPEGL